MASEEFIKLLTEFKKNNISQKEFEEAIESLRMNQIINLINNHTDDLINYLNSEDTTHSEIENFKHLMIMGKNDEVVSYMKKQIKGNIKTNKQGEFDVFISYASEDRVQVALPLKEELEKLGLNVWFDQSKMKIGSSLAESIAKGISKSRFAIIILSRYYINKGWTKTELNSIITKGSSNDEQNILPIWHNITKTEVENFNSLLVDKVARNTIDYSIFEIAKEIKDVLK